MPNQINIKTSWDEVTLNDYIQLQQIITSNIPEDYQLSNMVSVLTGLPLETIENLPLSQFLQLGNSLKFMNEKPKREVHKSEYILNGTTYVLTEDISKLTTAQFLDFQNFQRESPIDYTKILSCFLIPKGHSYNDGYDVTRVFNDMGSITVPQFQGLFFFLRLQSMSLYLILIDSLKRDMKKMKIPKGKKTQLTEQLETLSHSMAHLLMF